MARITVQRQCWQRWPRVLIAEKRNDDGTVDERRYVPEDGAGLVFERCEDCWYYVPEEWWEEPTEVGYPPMLMCEPPTCTGWSVPYEESRFMHTIPFVHTVPSDGHCHRWEPRYQVKPLLRFVDADGEVAF